MGIRSITKLKKVEEKKQTEKFVRNVIIGNDIFALNSLYEIRKKTEEVILYTDKEFDFNAIELKGPSQLRGDVNIEYFKVALKKEEVSISNGEPQFFKDLKFRKFGGRSKPEPIQWGEDFYQNQYANIDLDEIFPLEKIKENFNELLNSVTVAQVIKVKRILTEDMIENAKWYVEFSSGEQVRCENLIWNLNVDQFFSKIENKDSLSSEFIQYCDQTRTPSTLNITFEMDGELTEKRETLFIPLSYTHEWGHFICEFGEYNEEKNKQTAKFVLFVDKSQTSEEELARKIRLLKRNIEKIFPKFKKISYKEYIVLSDFSPCLKIDDSLAKNFLLEDNNLSFVGFNAPLVDQVSQEGLFGDSLFGLSHLARAHASTCLMLENFQ